MKKGYADTLGSVCTFKSRLGRFSRAFYNRSRKKSMNVITPHICEKFSLDAPPVSNYWWLKYN